MSKVSALAIGAILAVGAFYAVSRLAVPAAQSGPSGTTSAAPSSRRAKPNAATQERLEKLRSRVRELEALVAQQTQAGETTAGAAAPGAQADARNASHPDATKVVDLVKLSGSSSSRRNSLLKLKDSNPDAFARAVKTIDASAHQATQVAQKRLEFFSNLDESRLADDELSAHREILALLAAQQDVARLRAEWDVDADVESRLNRESSAIENRLRELYPAERKALLRQAAREYGYDNADAESFSQSLGDILGATQGEVFHY